MPLYDTYETKIKAFWNLICTMNLTIMNKYYLKSTLYISIHIGPLNFHYKVRQGPYISSLI